ncbi:translation initiation factor IF-2 [Buchnera aphidicola]|uniref:Translation initiation factor IF-2 n=1 Tax=Buchnera aphidicola (Therioaphis trifolii) TaxID=1241884 RepID=A0A4D6YBG0_9GAMM|nr:translation initiation factor IF-2 [Buchnera aphidicola]QCI27246.1 translation initiation factor IF-2 [Buchnera aphidicola (Therioaphis trifolii)]
MTNITLQSLSYEMNITVFELIKKFSNIGIIKKKDDYINLQEKKLLLHYLSSKNELSFNIKNEQKNVKSISDTLIQNQEKKKYYSNILKKNNNDNKINNYKYENINLKKNFSHIKSNLINTSIKNKNNVIKNKLEKINQKKDINSKNITNYKKNTVNIFKKNKITSLNQAIIKNLSSNNHLKKFTNLNSLDDINNIIEYDMHFNNKKKIKNKNIKNKNVDNIIKNKKKDLLHHNFIKPKKKIIKNILIHKKNLISELSDKMAIKSIHLIQEMKKKGNIFTSNQIVDQKTAQLIVEAMGHKSIVENLNILEESIIQEHKIMNKNIIKTIRPPIVTVMGHVDHGKTSLLDYIRSTKIASHEAGGITQHIGAYYVQNKKGIITFLDTPGHAAFTSMRARGTQITDIVILVVAVDDGVKPQTIEAIQHAKLANVPIIVAINKIDKPDSNPEKIKKELVKYDILPEEWGGENIFVNVSSITGSGIDDLLDAILLQAEMLELFALPSGMANGVVIEARLDKNKGPIATILIREGKLNKGDNVLCGLHWGRIRVIKNSFGKEVKSVGPSIPVEILGLSGIPISGDVFYSIKNEKKAREIALFRKNKSREMKLKKTKIVDLKNVFQNLKKDGIFCLNIILKSDLQGSLEVISNIIKNLSNDNIEIKIITANVGNITETDVSLAIASNAIIIGFNVEPNMSAKRLIKLENVNFYHYSIIYHLIDDIKLKIFEITSPKCKELILGSAEIRDIFKPSKSVFIAGCMVINGIIKRKNPIRILRDKKIIHSGELESLRRFKEDVKEVSFGKECGLGIKNYKNIRIGDIIESFKIIELKNVN